MYKCLHWRNICGFFFLINIVTYDDLHGENFTVPKESFTSETCSEFAQERNEPRKKPSCFPLNPGWLIGTLIMVFCNPHITAYPKQPRFFSLLKWNSATNKIQQTIKTKPLSSTLHAALLCFDLAQCLGHFFTNPNNALV